MNVLLAEQYAGTYGVSLWNKISNQFALKHLQGCLNWNMFYIYLDTC